MVHGPHNDAISADSVASLGPFGTVHQTNVLVACEVSRYTCTAHSARSLRNTYVSCVSNIVQY